MNRPFRTLALVMAGSVLFVWSDSLAVPGYRQRLPSHLQCGTCHLNAEGGGPRNVFGAAFVDAGRTWGEAFCEQDADGDTFSNGVELGDPECDWTVDQLQRQSASHPGDADDQPSDDPPPPPDDGGDEDDGGDDGDNGEPVQHGVRGEYFANGFTREASQCAGAVAPEDFVRIDETVDFYWADGSPVPGWCINGFSVRWTAWLTVPETGYYSFYMWGNDFADMYVDGKLISHSRHNAWSGDRIHLTADEPVRFRIDYGEGAAYAVIFLLWVPPWEPELPDIGWLMGEDIRGMFGERFVGRGHRLGLLLPTEYLTPREPPVDEVPVVEILPIDPLISEGRIARGWGVRHGLDDASFAIYSDKPMPHDMNVRIQIGGSAENGVDYLEGSHKALGSGRGPQLFDPDQGLPVYEQYGFSEMRFNQLDNERADGPREIEITILPGEGYQVGEDNHTVIRILDDEVPDGVPGVALGGWVRGLGAEEWAVVWVQRPNGGVLVSDIAFEDDIFILDNLPEDDLELHGAVDLNLNGVADPGEPRFAPEGISITVPPTRLDLVMDFERGLVIDREMGPAQPEAPPRPDEAPEPEDAPAPEGEPPPDEDPEAEGEAEAEDAPAPGGDPPPEGVPVPDDESGDEGAAPPEEEEPAAQPPPEEQPPEEQPPEEQPPEEQPPEEQPPEEQPPAEPPPESEPADAPRGAAEDTPGASGSEPEGQPAAEPRERHEAAPDPAPEHADRAGPQDRHDEQRQQQEGRIEQAPASSESPDHEATGDGSAGCIAADGHAATGWLLLLLIGCTRRRRS